MGSNQPTKESNQLPGESKQLTEESKHLTGKSKQLTGESNQLTEQSKQLTDDSNTMCYPMFDFNRVDLVEDFSVSYILQGESEKSIYRFGYNKSNRSMSM